MKTLYLESIAGIAGDMFSASFLDAGLITPDELYLLPQQMQLPDVKLIISDVIRASMHATHIQVQYDELAWQQRFTSLHHHSHMHAEENFHIHYSELEHLIIHTNLPEKTKEIAREILGTLAEAEAYCHGVKKEDVLFHELGMVDSIMDIVMAAYCISKVQPQSVMASPVKLGRGLVKTAHGTLPIPPPVSAALSIEMVTELLPLAIQQQHIELSTPTGLAILKTLKPVFSREWPEGKILAQGYGAGTKELNTYPNLFRCCLLETQEIMIDKALPYLSDTIVEINANYDDASPEYLSWAAEKLFAYGAVDVWQTTAIGKKGRVMIILSTLVPLSHWQQCVNFILKKTSTFGLRYKKLERFLLARHFETRNTKQGSFQVKVGCNTDGKILKEKFEFEEIKQTWDSNINT